MKRAWNYLLAEPFTWMFYALFQPRRFDREFGQVTLLLRVVLIPRLVASIAPVSSPLALLRRAILLPFHLLFHPDIASILGEAAGGIAFIVFYFMGFFGCRFTWRVILSLFTVSGHLFITIVVILLPFPYLHPPKRKQS